MGMYNKSKFVFSETFNNKDGKTSGSGFIGVYLGLIAGFGFIAGTFGFFFGIENTIEYLGMVIKLIAAATILLGARKFVGELSRRGKEEPEEPTAEPLFESKPENV